LRAITKQQVDNARGKSVWDLGNQVLYRLCEDYPDHHSDEAVIAKVWLIGRSYAAAVERRQSKLDDAVQGDAFYEKLVAPALRDSTIDEHIKKLREYHDVNTDSLHDILTTHKYLVDILAKITGQNKRSLASKYLHFHVPHLFFIYDSRAYDRLRTYRSFRDPLPDNTTYDHDYHKFCLKCVELREDIFKQHGIHLTPREIDNFLLQSQGNP